MDDPKSPLPSLDDQEESVRIAVRALGDMRNASLRSDNSRHPHSLSIQSSSPQSHQPPSSSSPRQSDPSPNSPAFVSRMSSFPLVGSALQFYEHGKASSRVVKYGAEMVESSVKTLSKPVINRLPVNVNQLDEFACRQLDRLDRYRRPSGGEAISPVATSSPSEPSTSEQRGRTRSRTPATSVPDDTPMGREPSESTRSTVDERTTSQVRLRKGWKEGGERGVPSWLEANSRSIASSSSRRPHSRSLTPTQKGNGNDGRSGQGDASASDSQQNQQQVAQRSRWQAVLLEAGGLSAALSEDSMRRLKYCLQWLQYATAHIDAQILILREFTASLQTYPPDAPAHARRPNPISEEHMRKLAEVRKDVVQTVRQVVDVVSKYAGGALPEPARSTVRGFILKLPQKWASKAGVPTTNGNAINPLAGAAAGERETVAAAAGSGTSAVHRRNGNRRAAHRERGAESGLRSTQSSRAPSPSSPRPARLGLAAASSIAQVQQQDAPSLSTSGAQVSHGTAMVAAQRILSLATESLDMMRGVTGVVKDSLDRAEGWISRLRSVGLQRNEGEPEGEGGARPEDLDLNEALESNGGPSQHHHRGLRHRRNSSSQFSEDLTMSPFFSGASTSTWNSSIPSTPGGPLSHGYPNAGRSSPSAMALPPIGQMSLHSRANTPKSVGGELPEEDESVMEGISVMKGSVNGKGDAVTAVAGPGVVKVAGVDDQDEGAVKMDVDA